MKRVAVSSALTLCGFFAAGLIMAPLVRLAGLGAIDEIASLPVFILVLFVFGLMILPLENAYSRRLEKKADAFSFEKGGRPEDFIRAMEKLAEQNLVRKRPNRAVEILLHGHPSISSRIAMAREYMERCQQEKFAFS